MTDTQRKLEYIATESGERTIREIARDLLEIGTETAASLRQTFGYAPDERGGERWTVFQDHTLIVIHPERRPRMYKRGCGGVFYEIQPD